MAELLENLVEFVKMIFGVIVTPNYGAESTNYNLIRWLFNPDIQSTSYIRALILIPFGIICIGGSIGILKRFLWKN